MHDPLVYFGSPVKVLKLHTREDGMEVATLGGHLVVFSGPDSPDLEGDFFTRETDFGTLSRKGAATLPAYYQHGFDPHFSNKAIGDAEVRFDEFGVWAEYQLELRTQYERHLLEMAQQGKLGQSSGAVAHLVERKAAGKTGWLKVWPLGEASLTPTPAEPRTSAIPLKSLFPDAFKAEKPAPEAAPEPTPAPESAPAPATANIVAAVQPEGNLVFAVRKAAPPEQSAARASDPAPVATPEPNQPTTPETATMSDQNQAAKAVNSETFQPATPDSAATLAAIERLEEQIKAMREDAKPGAPTQLNTPGAPAHLKMGRGDTEAKALGAFIRNADRGGVKHALIGENEVDIRALKASNDTDMNITTAADGGNAVPTGHYQGIVAKSNEVRLNLGFMPIPGKGTTVNVPTQAGTTNVFVTTAEAGAYDRDAPALGQVPMTLIKKTKKVELTEELLEDEDSKLIAFLNAYVGDAHGLTHNEVMLAEVLANGTSLKTTASATVLAAGELEDAVFQDVLARYLSGGASWVTRPSTYSKVLQITGNERHYAPTQQGQGASLRPDLLGYPVYWDSGTIQAYGTTTNKIAAFGNFRYVGVREGSLSVLRDPYSGAGSGLVRLHYHMRLAYKVLQAEAVGYIAHA